MMRRWLAVMTCLISTSAHADFWDGNEMHAFCADQYALVVGYAVGWSDKQERDTVAAMMSDINVSAAEGSSEAVKDSSRYAVLVARGGVCRPKGVTTGQIADVYCKYLGDHPESRHQLASDLLEKALSAAWPCK